MAYIHFFENKPIANLCHPSFFKGSITANLVKSDLLHKAIYK